MDRDLFVVSVDIGLLVGTAEEIEKMVVRIECANSGMLEPIQGDVGLTQVKPRYADIGCREHIEQIAAPGCNGKNMLTVFELQSLKVHLWVFPDLWIHQVIEKGCEEAV
jgi:hypothetical protein